MHQNDGKKHWNLYYILQYDKEQHPIPPAFLQQLRQRLEEIMCQRKEDS